MTTPQEPPFGGQPPGQPGGYPPPPPPGGYGTTPGYGAVQPGFGGMPSIPPPPGQWMGPPLASWGTRVGASLIDALIVFVPTVILVMLEAVAIGYLVNFGLSIYFQYLQGTTGQTPGKKALNIKLLREADGQVLGFPAAVGRSILHVVDGLPCGVGYLWPIWDPKKQTFADKIMSSVVVHA